MQPTEEERVLAALAHASIVANLANLAGLIGTALILISAGSRSAFVRRQAIAALCYQIAALLVGLALLVAWLLGLGLALLPVALRPDLYTDGPPGFFWLALWGGAVPLGFVLCAILYGLYGAAQVYAGRPFHYLLLERLGPPPEAPAPPAPPEVPAPPAS